MKARRITASIRKILDIMNKLEQQGREGWVLSVDFQKCFDMIDFEAIFKSMSFFSFGENMLKWTKVLYTDFTCCVQNNGFFSRPICIERSVHQGGPCSTYYFLLCAEVLALQL